MSFISKESTIPSPRDNDAHHQQDESDAGKILDLHTSFTNQTEGSLFFVIPEYRHGPPRKERISQSQALVRPNSPSQQGLRSLPTCPQLSRPFRSQAKGRQEDSQEPKGLNGHF